MRGSPPSRSPRYLSPRTDGGRQVDGRYPGVARRARADRRGGRRQDAAFTPGHPHAVDAFKALVLGVDVVLIGRPYVVRPRAWTGRRAPAGVMRSLVDGARGGGPGRPATGASDTSSRLFSGPRARRNGAQTSENTPLSSSRGPLAAAAATVLVLLCACCGAFGSPRRSSASSRGPPLPGRAPGARSASDQFDTPLPPEPHIADEKPIFTTHLSDGEVVRAVASGPEDARRDPLRGAGGAAAACVERACAASAADLARTVPRTATSRSTSSGDRCSGWRNAVLRLSSAVTDVRSWRTRRRCRQRPGGRGPLDDVDVRLRRSWSTSVEGVCRGCAERLLAGLSALDGRGCVRFARSSGARGLAGDTDRVPSPPQPGEGGLRSRRIRKEWRWLIVLGGIQNAADCAEGRAAASTASSRRTSADAAVPSGVGMIDRPAAIIADAVGGQGSLSCSGPCVRMGHRRHPGRWLSGPRSVLIGRSYVHTAWRS